MSRRRKAMISFAVGLAAAILFGTGSGKAPAAFQPSFPYVGAWWGCLYPRFCFAPVGENAEKELHFSLWVAKALDWC